MNGHADRTVDSPGSRRVGISPGPRRPAVLIGLSLVIAAICSPASAANPPPNIIIIFADDLGYGDLGCYGHPSIKTPHLDRMAAEGQRWTDFYSAAPVCTPSRAALLTGRLPVRSGMTSKKIRVLFPHSKGGLPASEVTLAEALKERGYATHCVGKWHLGHLPPYLPMSHGFDSYFGIPYSNDMDRTAEGPRGRPAFDDPRSEYWNVPLMRNEQIIERPADQTTITQRYTQEAINLIRSHKSKPFFLYLAHTMPHVPLFRSREFQGRSARGLYGDVIEELDWSVGQIVKTLRSEDLAEKTVVFVTSDNGPWLIYDAQGGSAGLLRDGKGSTWEGGMRVPFIAWWPGQIKPGLVHDIGCAMDLFNTCIALAGGKVPTDRAIDGYDISPALLGRGPSPRQEMFFYRDVELFAVRQGAFKAHFVTQAAYGAPQPEIHDPPQLYHLGQDPSEKFNMAADHPQVISKMRERMANHRATVETVENQLEK
jgi:arylsulfatase A